jgi:hypothetical protein
MSTYWLLIQITHYNSCTYFSHSVKWNDHLYTFPILLKLQLITEFIIHQYLSKAQQRRYIWLATLSFEEASADEESNWSSMFYSICEWAKLLCMKWCTWLLSIKGMLSKNLQCRLNVTDFRTTFRFKRDSRDWLNPWLCIDTPNYPCGLPHHQDLAFLLGLRLMTVRNVSWIILSRKQSEIYSWCRTVQYEVTQISRIMSQNI